eukprot:1324615-Pyramimonas_sp.AAC.1
MPVISRGTTPMESPRHAPAGKGGQAHQAADDGPLPEGREATVRRGTSKLFWPAPAQLPLKQQDQVFVVIP